MGCHAERAKETASSVPFPLYPLGISPSPNCRQIEMSGIQRSGKTNNSLTVPIPLFAFPFRPAWLRTLAASTQAMSCCTAGLRCARLSLQPATLNFVPVLVWRLMILRSQSGLCEGKTVCLNFITFNVFFSPPPAPILWAPTQQMKHPETKAADFFFSIFQWFGWGKQSKGKAEACLFIACYKQSNSDFALCRKLPYKQAGLLSYYHPEADLEKLPSDHW